MAESLSAIAGIGSVLGLRGWPGFRVSALTLEVPVTATIPSAALVPVQPVFTDSERLTLAGYRGLTTEAYALGLRQSATWCRGRSLRSRRGYLCETGYRTDVDIPELADLTWLFEAEPSAAFPDLVWPIGLQSFRLRRGDREVLFSLDPLAGDAHTTLYAGGEEAASIGRLRRLARLSVIRRDGYEGLELWFTGAKLEPLSLQTKPGIKLSWDVVPPGTW